MPWVGETMVSRGSEDEMVIVNPRSYSSGSSLRAYGTVAEAGLGAAFAFAGAGW